MIKTKLTALILICLSFTKVGNAQINSPYSRAGMGMPYESETIPLESMGGLSAAYSSLIQVNPNNPASYASMVRTCLEFGITGKVSKLTGDRGSIQQGKGSLNGLSLGFPVYDKKDIQIGVGVGVLPVTSFDHRLQSNIEIPNYGSTRYNFTGYGGINKFFLGTGVKYKSIAFGVNANYMFGRNDITDITSYDSLAYSVSLVHQLNSNYYGINWTLASQFDQKFGKYRLRAGLSYNVSSNINRKLKDVYTRNYETATNFILIDTVYSNINKKQSIKYPSGVNAGVIISQASKWLVGVNFKSTSWSEYKGTSYQKLQNTLLTSVGAEYIPNYNDPLSYFKRVRYRAGFFAGNELYETNAQKRQHIGASVGLGLPIRKDASVINLGITVGNKGKVSSTTLREQYARFTIGVSFAEAWFLRKKYE